MKLEKLGSLTSEYIIELAKKFITYDFMRKKKKKNFFASSIQSLSNQVGMALAQKQKYRSMEQAREPRDKLTNPWPTNLRQRRQEYTMDKRRTLQ